MYLYFCFFFNDTATTEIYTLSLHDALPIWDRGERGQHELRRRRARAGDLRYARGQGGPAPRRREDGDPRGPAPDGVRDRKSTRLNSSHANISYAVFCLKKKKKQQYRVQKRH